MTTERPKRPLSAYMLWLGETRESIKAENPGIKVTEVAKRGGELWRGLTDKTEWENKAAQRKDEYTRAVKAFEANGGGKEVTKKRRKAGSAVAKKPKKRNDSEEEDEEESE